MQLNKNIIIIFMICFKKIQEGDVNFYSRISAFNNNFLLIINLFEIIIIFLFLIKQKIKISLIFLIYPLYYYLLLFSFLKYYSIYYLWIF